MYQIFLRFIRSELAFMIAVCSIAFGLYFSHFPVLMSGGAVLVFVSGLFQNNFKETLKNKYFLALLFLFMLMILSFFYASNIHDWGTETQRKLSFLLIGFGLVANKKYINKKSAAQVFLFFLASTTIVAIATFVHYILRYDYYNQKILESQGLPIVSGVSHITFSILCSFAIGLCIYMYMNATLLFKNSILSNKNIYIIIGFILFVIFHFISSRTGWVSLYFALGVFVIHQIIKSKKYLMGLGILALVGVFPVLAFYFSTAFHNKIINTIDDVSRYFNGEYIGFYSVSMRFEAWRVCWAIFTEHPLLGIGSTDLGQIMQLKYDQFQTSGYARVFEAHNQFLEYAVCYGLIGIVSIVYTFYLILQGAGKRSMLSLYFFCVCFGAFMFESFLEIQVGIAFFSLFYVIVNYLKESNE
ncbi:MAG: O-antigen ligase family protein [Bacteroidetes bacterium]|nr:O-antigen ligase family protein [Bacteroidota bacterium]